MENSTKALVPLVPESYIDDSHTILSSSRNLMASRNLETPLLSNKNFESIDRNFLLRDSYFSANVKFHRNPGNYQDLKFDEVENESDIIGGIYDSAQQSRLTSHIEPKVEKDSKKIRDRNLKLYSSFNQQIGRNRQPLSQTLKQENIFSLRNRFCPIEQPNFRKRGRVMSYSTEDMMKQLRGKKSLSSRHSPAMNQKYAYNRFTEKNNFNPDFDFKKQKMKKFTIIPGREKIENEENDNQMKQIDISSYIQEQRKLLQSIRSKSRKRMKFNSQKFLSKKNGNMENKSDKRTKYGKNLKVILDLDESEEEKYRSESQKYEKDLIFKSYQNISNINKRGFRDRNKAGVTSKFKSSSRIEGERARNSKKPKLKTLMAKIDKSKKDFERRTKRVTDLLRRGSEALKARKRRQKIKSSLNAIPKNFFHENRTISSGSNNKNYLFERNRLNFRKENPSFENNPRLGTSDTKKYNLDRFKNNNFLTHENKNDESSSLWPNTTIKKPPQNIEEKKEFEQKEINSKKKQSEFFDTIDSNIIQNSRNRFASEQLKTPLHQRSYLNRTQIDAPNTESKYQSPELVNLKKRRGACNTDLIPSKRISKRAYSPKNLTSTTATNIQTSPQSTNNGKKPQLIIIGESVDVSLAEAFRSKKEKKFLEGKSKRLASKNRKKLRNATGENSLISSTAAPKRRCNGKGKNEVKNNTIISKKEEGIKKSNTVNLDRKALRKKMMEYGRKRRLKRKGKKKEVESDFKSEGQLDFFDDSKSFISLDDEKLAKVGIRTTNPQYEKKKMRKAQKNLNKRKQKSPRIEVMERLARGLKPEIDKKEIQKITRRQLNRFKKMKEKGNASSPIPKTKEERIKEIRERKMKRLRNKLKRMKSRGKSSKRKELLQ